MALRSATHLSPPVPSAHSGVSFYKYEIMEDMNSSGQVPHTLSDELEVQCACDPASFHLPYIYFRFVSLPPLCRLPHVPFSLLLHRVLGS